MLPLFCVHQDRTIGPPPPVEFVQLNIKFLVIFILNVRMFDVIHEPFFDFHPDSKLLMSLLPPPFPLPFRRQLYLDLHWRTPSLNSLQTYLPFVCWYISYSLVRWIRFQEFVLTRSTKSGAPYPTHSFHHDLMVFLSVPDLVRSKILGTFSQYYNRTDVTFTETFQKVVLLVYHFTYETSQ